MGGGTRSDGDQTDTWHFAAGVWSLQASAGQPSGSRDFQLAFESNGSRLVGYSGLDPNQSTVSSDIHEYEGTPLQWTDTGTSGPDERYGHGWAGAPPFGGALMFGGRACCFVSSYFLVDDTWTLEGINWRLHTPLTRPTARYDLGLTFDSQLGKAVLYGGRDDIGTEFEDTWLYDNQDWQLVSASSLPGPRRSLSLIYDSARGRTVLFGDGPPDEGVTWEFDGTTWLAQPTPFQPDSQRCWSPMAYDSKREVVLMFGGRYCGSNVYFNDTWAYGPDPDGDGIVGGLDNCRDTHNTGQANGDGDPAGDACDCAPADGGSFASPQEATNFQAAGAVSTDLSWEDQSPQVGTGVVYDLVTGSLAALASTGSFAGATCLASDLIAPSHSDTRTPAVGDGFYYVVRARNACGAGTYGPNRAALDAALPCP